MQLRAASLPCTQEIPGRPVAGRAACADVGPTCTHSPDFQLNAILPTLPNAASRRGPRQALGARHNKRKKTSCEA